MKKKQFLFSIHSIWQPIQICWRKMVIIVLSVENGIWEIAWHHSMVFRNGILLEEVVVHIFNQILWKTESWSSRIAMWQIWLEKMPEKRWKCLLKGELRSIWVCISQLRTVHGMKKIIRKSIWIYTEIVLLRRRLICRFILIRSRPVLMEQGSGERNCSEDIMQRLQQWIIKSDLYWIC